MAGAIDLAKIFSTVASTLAENQSALNLADTYNHDHGDHMVEVFNVASKAVSARDVKNATPAEKLAYASKQISNQSKSGSGQLYAQGFAQAAQQLQGKQQIQPDMALALINALMGGGQPAASKGQSNAPADLLGTLLGGGSSSQAQQGSPAGDLLGTLLGGKSSGASGTTQSDGIDMNDILSAGMSFMAAKQKGSSNLEAIIQALVGNSAMAESPHRSQSASIVASTLLKLLTANR
jgi:hypothetical protein